MTAERTVWFSFVCFVLFSSAFSQDARLPDQQLSTNTDSEMASLLDALTIYEPVVSLLPSEATLVKCCQTASMTPHLDLLFVFGRHVHAWFKYASVSLMTLLSDQTAIPPCLPEVKTPDSPFGGEGGQSSIPFPPPSSPPASPSAQPAVYRKFTGHYQSFPPAGSGQPYHTMRPKRRRRQRKQRRKRRWRDRRQSRMKITALGSATFSEQDLSPTFWLLSGAALGFGLAIVWNWIHASSYNAFRRQDAEEFGKSFAKALSDCFRDTDDTDHRHPPGMIFVSDNAYNQNDLLMRRFRKLHSRIKRRGQPRYRGGICQTDSQLLSISSGSSQMSESGSFANRSNHSIHADERTMRFLSNSMTKRNTMYAKHGDTRLRRRRKGRRYPRHKKRSSHNVRDPRYFPQQHPMTFRKQSAPMMSRRRPDPVVIRTQVEPAMSRRLAYKSTHRFRSPVLEVISTSESSPTSGEQWQPIVDAVQPDIGCWDDSDEYSEAHSVNEKGSGSFSTCSSLRDEFGGPWVSTSLSFVVYDLDVIDDIPDEVMEVLCCNARPCHVHPHQRYHYVGSKIIVQRLPLLSKTSDRATSTTFLPQIDISCLSKSSPSRTDKSQAAADRESSAPLHPQTSKKHVRIVTAKEKGDISNKKPTSHSSDATVQTPSQYQPDPSDDVRITMTATADEAETLDCSVETVSLAKLLVEMVETGIPYIAPSSSTINAQNTELSHSSSIIHPKNGETNIEGSGEIQEQDVSDSLEQTASQNDQIVQDSLAGTSSNLEQTASQNDQIVQDSLAGTSSNLEQTASQNDQIVQDSLTGTSSNLEQTASQNDQIVQDSLTGTSSNLEQTASQNDQIVQDSLTGTSSNLEQTASQNDQDMQECSVPTLPEEEERVFVSTAANTDNVDVTDCSVQTSPEEDPQTQKQALISTAANTEPVDIADSSMQTIPEETKDLVCTAANTDLVDIAESSVQTDWDQFLVSTAANTEHVDIADSSVQAFPQTAEISSQTTPEKKKSLVSIAANTVQVDMADSSNQTSLEKQVSLTDTAANTEQTSTIEVDVQTMPIEPEVTVTEDAANQTDLESPKPQQNTCGSQTEPMNLHEVAQRTESVNNLPQISTHLPEVADRTESVNNFPQISTSLQISPIIHIPNSSGEQHSPTYPSNYMSPRVTVPLAKPVSPKKLTVSCVMENIKETYERCMTESQNKQKSSDKVRSRDKSKHDTSYSKDEANRQYPMQFVIDTVKDVYDYCLNEDSVEHLGTSTAMTGYPPNDHRESVRMFETSRCLPSKQDTVKSVTANVDKETEKCHDVYSIDEDLIERLGTSTAMTGYPPSNHRESVRMFETRKYLPSKQGAVKSVTANVDKETEKCQGRSSDKVVPVLHETPVSPHRRLKETQTITTSSRNIPNETLRAQQTGNTTQTANALHSEAKVDESAPDKTRLFAELKEKVAKRKSLEDNRLSNDTGIPSTNQHMSQQRARDQKTESTSEQNVPSPSHQNDKRSSSQKICIIPQQKKESGSPQRVCINLQPKKDSVSPQKICIIPQQKEDSRSLQTVCIIPGPNDKVCIGSKNSSQRVCILPASKGKSQQRPFGSPQEETTPAQQSSVLPQTTETESTLSKLCNEQTTVKTMAALFRTKCEPRVTDCSTDTIRSPSPTPIHCAGDEQNELATVKNNSVRPPWGNVEQVFENQRKRSLSSNNESISTIRRNISEVYERCMAAKSKARRTQGRNNQSVPQVTRPGYQQFEKDHSTDRHVLSETTTAEKEKVSSLQSKGATSLSEQHVENLRQTMPRENDDIQHHVGDSTHIPLLPFAFPMTSRPGPGNPPSPDQDSSNSAERDNLEVIQTENTQASPNFEKKNLYQSLSKASVKESSPPWEVSDRAKNNVFSPIGWTSPRSGVTSLFRGQGQDKISQTNDVNKCQSTKSSPAEKESYEKLTRRQNMGDNHQEQSHIYHCSKKVTIQPSDYEFYQKAHDLFRPYSGNSFLTCSTTEVCSSVSGVSNFSEKHGTIKEISSSGLQTGLQVVGSSTQRKDASIAQQKNCEEAAVIPAEHQPRIMNTYKSPLIFKSPGPQLTNFSKDLFPSKPDPVQYMKGTDSESYSKKREQSIEKDPNFCLFKRDETPQFGERNEVAQSRECSRSQHSIEKYRKPQSGKRDNIIQPCTDNIPKTSEKGKSLQMKKKDESASNLGSQRHRQCRYPNDINEELKNKLSKTRTPSQVKKAVMEIDNQAMIQRENFQSKLTTKEFDDTSTIPRPKPRCQLPVYTPGRLSHKEYKKCSTPLENDMNQTDTESDIKSNSASSLRSSSRSSVQNSTASSFSSIHAYGTQIGVKDAKIAAEKQAKESTKHDLRAVSTCTKLSRIPVAQISKDEKQEQRVSNARVKLQGSQSTSSCHKKSVTGSTPCTKPDVQTTAGVSKTTTDVKSNSLNFQKGTVIPKPEKAVRTNYKRSSSKLPLPQSTPSQVPPSEASHALKTKKPVSPMISKRIKLLQHSMSEKLNMTSQETKPIRKLTSYLELDTNDNSQNLKNNAAGDVKEYEKSLQPVRQEANRAKKHRLRGVKQDHSRQATHGEILFMPEMLDNKHTETRKCVKRRYEKEPGSFASQNTSQNHNESDSSFDSLLFASALQSESSQYVDCFSTDTLNLSIAQLVFNEDENCMENSSSFETAHLPSSSSSVSPLVTKHLEFSGMKYESQVEVNPAESKQCSLMYSRLNDVDRSSTSTAHNDISNKKDRSASFGKTFCHNIQKNEFKSGPTNSTVPQSSKSTKTQNKLKRCRSLSDLPLAFLSCHRHNTCGSEQGNSHNLLQSTNCNTAPCWQYETIRNRAADNKTLDELSESKLLSDQGFLSMGEKNSFEILRLIGPPQASSSFVEDAATTGMILRKSSCTSAVTSRPCLHLHGQNGACQTFSVSSSQLEGEAIGSSVDENVSQSELCHDSLDAVASSTGWYRWKETGGTNDIPITGSPDVMSTVPASLAKDSDPPSTLSLDDGNGKAGDDEAPHDGIDISRGLRFYGHSSFLEIGVAWMLQQTVNRISARGDNISNMNSDPFGTAACADTKNASF